MELKWLEDLLSVAEIGHFSRAAEARLVTQSALSRRIQALELWVGAELLDRSQHPISLTPEGEEFIPVAQQIIAASHDAKRKAMASSRIADTGVRVACLHTLALYFLPQLCADLRRSIGDFETSIVAETRTIEEYLTALQNGGSDFFISYNHPSVPFNIDPIAFPSKQIGIDRMMPYGIEDGLLNKIYDGSKETIPYLEYSKTSYMSHIVDHILENAPNRVNLSTVFRASLAESLYSAAHSGLGVGWLPQSVIRGRMATASPELQTAEPVALAEWSTPMTIRIYRSAENNIRTVEAIWSALDKFFPSEGQ